MKAVFYYIFTFLAWLISLLPLQVLYIFSYLLFFIFYYFPGYRKEVVLKNLRLSFPEKSEDEIKAISKRFYLHLSDMFIEGIKLRHMSSKELLRRYKYINPELMNSYFDSGQDAIAAFGHYGNWEWIAGMHKVVKYRVMTVYKPLHNKYFDQYFYDLRSRYGMDIVPMSSILRKILQYQKEGINTLTCLVADQTPPRKEIHFWTEFLNQDTPVYLGVEKIAAKFNMAVFFLKINKVKRGYYEVEAELLTDRPGKMDEFELTRMHMNKLEKEIREKPEYWLWSHRRWKYKRSTNK
jgi:KDO2-lipid IV(A) lauroyltransferase